MPTSSRQPGEYLEKKRLVLLGMMSGFVTFSLKCAAALLSNSLIIFTDLLRSVGETLAFFLAWLTMRRIVKGQATGYEYGYGKLESMSSLLLAGVLFVTLIVALGGAMERFRHPVDVHRVELGFFVAVGATAWSTFVWRRNMRRARRDPSPIIDSHWHLFRNKAIANSCVVGGLALGEAFEGNPWAMYVDPATSLIMCGFMTYSIYSVVSKNTADLLDRALDESLQLVILRALTRHFDDYVEFHGLRSRRSGKSVYIELFLEFEGSRTMADVQKTIDAIKADLEGQIRGSQVTISPTTARVI